MKTLIRAATLRSFAAGRPHTEIADILVEGPRIAEVAAAGSIVGAADITLIDGSGHLVMPGLINAHFHSPVNHPRARSTVSRWRSSCSTRAPACRG